MKLYLELSTVAYQKCPFWPVSERLLLHEVWLLLWLFSFCHILALQNLTWFILKENVAPTYIHPLVLCMGKSDVFKEMGKGFLLSVEIKSGWAPVQPLSRAFHTPHWIILPMLTIQSLAWRWGIVTEDSVTEKCQFTPSKPQPFSALYYKTKRW